ncbi:uncharacterized protein LOC108219281 isoform X2 [Daucus carota subsp. sativus]|uniref:uncharacterized protein LOC108219281 isoform X2 n=1 Tax=Daucus carota subsp. sativus TaxID=79200 RepID=UPI0007EF7358|nr:PREDICTED: uncharacterized protein LOC108219281 isoform X2 [Daucus carota subsp. sativus]
MTSFYICVFLVSFFAPEIAFSLAELPSQYQPELPPCMPSELLFVNTSQHGVGQTSNRTFARRLAPSEGNFNYWRLLFFHSDTYFQAEMTFVWQMEIILDSCHGKGSFSGLEVSLIMLKRSLSGELIIFPRLLILPVTAYTELRHRRGDLGFSCCLRPSSDL